MQARQTYEVLVDCLCDGTIHRKGSTVELTDKQARYLLLNKKIAQVQQSAAPAAKKSTKRKKGINNA